MGTMTIHTRKAFPRAALAELDDAPIVGVRSGNTHRYTHIWVVVVRGRVFGRSWGDKPTGWYRAFVAQPDGWIQAGDRELRVRARRVRAAGILDAMEDAYAEKFSSKGSRKWVRGFRAASRRAHSLEFVPR
jgi:hypothetical protein